MSSIILQNQHDTPTSCFLFCVGAKSIIRQTPSNFSAISIRFNRLQNFFFFPFDPLPGNILWQGVCWAVSPGQHKFF
jgi:hypothetical protein